MKPNTHFSSYLAQFFLQLEVFHTKIVEKIKTHFVFKNFFLEKPALYEIIWKNIVQGASHRRQYGACALHAG